MKARAGPATTFTVARSMTSVVSGWPSLVMKRATGPLMPCGTTHWESGRGMEEVAFAIIIWQKSFCGRGKKVFQFVAMRDVGIEKLTSLGIVPLMELAWKVTRVPGPTVPLLVTVRGTLEGMVRLHPLMKGETMARTSLGVKARSNGEETTVPVLEKRLRTVW